MKLVRNIKKNTTIFAAWKYKTVCCKADTMIAIAFDDYFFSFRMFRRKRKEKIKEKKKKKKK